MEQFKDNNIFGGEPLKVESNISKRNSDILKGLFEPKDNLPMNTLPSGRNTPDIRGASFTKELPLGTYINPSSFDAYIETIAVNQTIPELVGKSLFNMGTEFLGGFIEGVGAIPMIIPRIAGAQEAFESNFLEEIGAGITDWGREVMPIYQTKDARENLAMGDATFWANLAPSMASSLSILLPVMGTMKIASMLGKGSKALMLTQAANTINNGGKVTKLGKLLNAERMVVNGQTASQFLDMSARAARLAGKSNIMSDILMPALLSRSLDSSREAVGRYKQIYEQYKDTLGEEEARELASDAAHKGYLSSYGNILFDVVEWTFLGGALSKVDKALTSRVKNELFKNSEYMATTVGETFGKNALKSLRQSTILSTLGNYSKVAISEGFDETFMDFFMNEGTRSALIKKGLQEDDGTSFIERIVKHHKVAKNYESFIGGVLGGVVMAGGADLIGTLKYKYFDKNGQQYVKNIAESFFERASETDNVLKQIGKLYETKETAHVNTAKILLNKHIAEVLHKSAMSNSLDLDIERLKRIAAIDINNPENAQIVQQLGLTKESQEAVSGMVKTLEENSTMFASEFANVRHKDENLNRAINAEIAYYKTIINLNNKHLETLTDKDISTDAAIDDTSRIVLNSMPEQATTYYNMQKQTAAELRELDNSIGAKESTIAMFNQLIAEYSTKLENASENEKGFYESNISYFSDTVTQLEKEKTTLEDKRKSKEETSNESKKLIDNLSEFESKVNDLIENEATAKDTFSNRASIREVIKETNKALEDKIASSVSPEGIKSHEKRYNAQVSFTNGLILSDFSNNIKDLTDEKEIRKKHKEYIKNNTGLNGKATYKGKEDTVLNHIDSILNDKLKELETKAKNEKKADENISNPVVPVDEEGTKAGHQTSASPSFTRSSTSSANQIESPLEEAIILEQSKISFDEDTHKYTYTTAEGQPIKNSVSASEVRKSENIEVNRIGTAASKVGNQVDKLVRDFFNSELQPAVMYGLNDESYKATVEYLVKLKEYFDKLGLKVLANNIKLFDPETGIAGTIDILAIDKNNNAYIFDTKTTAKEFTVEDGKVSKYITQVNIYSKLLAKLYPNVKVKGLGLLPFKVSYNIGNMSDETLNDKTTIVKIQSITPLQVNPKTLTTIQEQEGFIIKHETNGLITFPESNLALRHQSVITDEEGNPMTIAKVFGTAILRDSNVMLDSNLTDEQIAKQYNDFLSYLRTFRDTLTDENQKTLVSSLINTINVLFKTISVEIDGKQVNHLMVNPSLKFIIHNYFKESDNFNVKDIFIREYNKAIDEFNKMFSKETYEGNTVLSTIENLGEILTLKFYTDFRLLNRNNDVNNKIEDLSRHDELLLKRAESIFRFINTINFKMSPAEMSANYVYLALDLLEFKSIKTLNNSEEITFDEMVFVLLDIYNMLDMPTDNLAYLASSLPTVYRYIRDMYRIQLKYIVDKEIKAALNEDKDSTLTYDPETFIITDANGNEYVPRLEDSMHYDKYKMLFNALKINKRLLNDNFKFTPYIENLVKKYEYNISSQNNALKGQINKALSNDVETHKKLQALRSTKNNSVGNKVYVRLNGNNEIEMYVDGIEQPISIIQSISDTFKTLNIVDSNGRISIPEIENASSNSKVVQLFSDKDFGEFLKNLHKQRLIAKSNNRSKQDKLTATNQYTVFLQEFSESKEPNILKFKELLNIFIKDESNYTEDNIAKVLDILFHNQYLNYIDSVNVTPSFIKSTVTKFITNANTNNDKYAATKKAIEQFDEVQSEIADISLPSLNFKESNAEKESLKDSVGKIEIDGQKEIVLVVYKDGKISHARKDRIIEPKYVEGLQTKGFNGIYALIPTMDGKVSPVKLKARTLGESYGNIDGDIYTKKALEYVSETLLGLVNVAVEELRVKAGETEIRLVSEEDTARLNEQINNIIDKSRIKDIIIYKPGDDNTYPYFQTMFFVNRDINNEEPYIEQVIKFKTKSAGGNIEYHKIVVTDEGIKYYTVNEDLIKEASIENGKFNESKYNKEVKLRIQALINPKGKEVKYQIPETSLSENQLRELIIKLTPSLLRQSLYDENAKLTFASKSDKSAVNSIVDPITGKEYNDAVDYALDTDSLYENFNHLDETIVDDEGNSTKEVVSNINLFEGASVTFGFDVINVTKFKEGVIDNPVQVMSVIAQTSKPELLPLLDVVESIVSELKDSYNNLEVIHESVNSPKVKLATTSGIRKAGELMQIKVQYANALLKNSNTRGISIHPVIAFIHEHLHVLLTSVGQLEINDSNKEQIKSLIANNNALLERLINEFSKDFESSITNEEYLKQLRSIYGVGNEDIQIQSVIDTLRNFIKSIQKDIVDSNSLLDNEHISDGMAQEFYAYLTDPYFMSVLSITTPSDMKYDRKSKPNFIDKLIDLLVKLYKQLVDHLSGSYGFQVGNENYTKILKDVLADFYSDLKTPSNEVKPDNKPEVEVEEVKTEETTEEDDDLDFDTDLPTREIKDFSNLQDSKNILIFTETNQHLDDNLLPIC